MTAMEQGGGGDAAPRGAEVMVAAGISKHFDETVALDGVSLSVAPGEVLGLCGHNGCGKSTFIKVLSGYHHPEAGGRLQLDGQDVAFPIDPSTTRSLGMAFVHQDLGIVDALSVIDNLAINRWSSQLGRISWRRERRECVEALRQFGIEADPDAPASRLSAAEKTILAIVRSLQALEKPTGGLFVLDEPTTHLPLGETERLFAAVETLKQRGHGVIFVSHRLNEVLRVCDRVAVLRSGRLVATERATDLTEQALADLIVGRELRTHERVDRSHNESVALGVAGVSGGRVRDVDFELHAGEILGITGLAGCGFEDVPYLLYGAIPLDAGSLAVDGKAQSVRDPRRAMALGMALVPDERLRLAATAEGTVMENLTLPLLERFTQGAVLRRSRERPATQALLDQHSVLPPNPEAKFGSLSGGNQQKVVLARALASAPRILLLHEPAQGVDIEARNHIFREIDQAARGGAAILLATTEYEDLARIANRVIVLEQGAVKAVIGGAELTADAIEHACLVS